MMRHIQIMQKIALLTLLGAGLAACNVHEWPDTAAREQVSLKLAYATAFTQQEYTCDDTTLTESGDLTTTDNTLTHGYMHYIVRAYPGGGSGASQGASTANSSAKSAATQTASGYAWEEFRFTRDISAGYDCDLQLELAPGSYTIRVWSMLTETETDEPYYDAADFAEITLLGAHAGSTDYRDAFRGTSELTIDAYSGGAVPASCRVAMERPLAKYEFVATDAADFLAQAGEGASLGDYEAVFRYTGYMPSAYSMLIDKPVDSWLEVSFGSEVRALGSAEASLGFDYVFVNGTESAVTVQVELRRKSDDAVVARTKELRVPLRRGRHTVIRGAFISDTAPGTSSGGVGVNPGFDGDFNIPL